MQARAACLLTPSPSHVHKSCHFPPRDCMCRLRTAAISMLGTGGAGGGEATASTHTARVLVVLGPTGTGKTKVAVEIAQAYDGEVVNADAMQLYQGLEIATAQATEEEMQGIRHHLLGFLEPDEVWTVREFRVNALKAVADIHGRGKLAIVVGGTNYYIESLLWETSTLLMPPIHMPTSATKGDDEEGEASGPSLHEQLRAIDPVMADRLHPNDHRKIKNSLQVYARYGRSHSELLEEQQREGQGVATPLFDRCAILWLDAADEVLRPRLDRRVDKMLERGLVEEVRRLWDRFGSKAGQTDGSQDLEKEEQGGRAGGDQSSPPPPPPLDEGGDGHAALSFVHGIRQAIGFKELAPYVSAASPSPSLLETCVSHLKARTWKYVKRQRQWLRGGRLTHQTSIPIYRLDTSLMEEGGETAERDVIGPALHLARTLLGDDHDDDYDGAAALPAALIPCNEELQGGSTLVGRFRRDDIRHDRHECQQCGVVRHGVTAWQDHLRSKQHRRARRARSSFRGREDHVIMPTAGTAAVSPSSPSAKARSLSVGGGGDDGATSRGEGVDSGDDIGFEGCWLLDYDYDDDNNKNNEG